MSRPHTAKLPNTIGNHHGNSLDNQGTVALGASAPAENLYALTICPAGTGDRDALTALAKKLLLPATRKVTGKLTTLSIAPVSKGDMLTFQREAERLKLPSSVALKNRRGPWT